MFRKTLRPGVGGGSLKFNPLNGELIYNDVSILDPEKRTLAPAIYPFSVVNAYRPAGAKVYLGERLLQTAEGTIDLCPHFSAAPASRLGRPFGPHKPRCHHLCEDPGCCRACPGSQSLQSNNPRSFY